MWRKIKNLNWTAIVAWSVIALITWKLWSFLLG